jgi:hypothetical protein
MDELAEMHYADHGDPEYDDDRPDYEPDCEPYDIQRDDELLDEPLKEAKHE